MAVTSHARLYETGVIDTGQPRNLPPAAFVDPAGENAEAVRDLVEPVLDELLDQLTSAGERSPLPGDPTVPRADVPASSRGNEALAADLATVVEGSMNPAHSGYIGHMDTMPTTVSMLGDLVAAAINNNMLSVEMSPVLSELEVALVEEVAAEFGLGPASRTCGARARRRTWGSCPSRGPATPTC
jgi:L-2,4-diaminobutyrate decarboxylase